MLYMDRDTAPDEQEQFEAYQQVLLSAQGKPVIFRTMDIGGDKHPYLNIPRKKTRSSAIAPFPFIPNLPISSALRKLRAILRAGASGNALLMIPMVHSLDQILWIKQELQNVRDAWPHRGYVTPHTCRWGSWLKCLQSALSSIFCEEVDFFSISSNDMTQYLYAVDHPTTRAFQGCITPSHRLFYAWFARSSPQRIVTGNGSAFAGSGESSAAFLFCLGWA